MVENKKKTASVIFLKYATANYPWESEAGKNTKN